MRRVGERVSLGNLIRYMFVLCLGEFYALLVFSTVYPINGSLFVDCHIFCNFYISSKQIVQMKGVCQRNDLSEKVKIMPCNDPPQTTL
jgi:hypothetical protein